MGLNWRSAPLAGGGPAGLQQPGAGRRRGLRGCAAALPSQQPPPSLLGPSPADVGGGGGSTCAASCSGAVTVLVGKRACCAHRAILAAGSEYFARLLAPEGGFAESGAVEVALPDADPSAFAHLLSYMYGTHRGLPCTQLLAVPAELLRPTAELAGRLLMSPAVTAQLTERLAARTTAATVLSDLVWADAHGLTELAERLRAFAVRKRKALELDGVEELAERYPQQAAKLLRAFAKV
ncbi:hypothetical protein HYH03_012174 [Edaphochlamys debaryana]|uniref:BTB domain-containing protein n=1 Tax=Edaphochlamys debaryana TaxID=47281 RepID=A0A835XT98_9CHLO|nr:hypothetical protein HYH03_012174 [Edaphochlamys debaryana]|eukprot:KAG2489344.1 hypothetical protein HYH03_012174 [Edaphochlamys debaryana]